MMRSNTSITGPTETISPVSSSTSRAQASSSVSPSSTPPPGRFHSPISGSCARLTRTIRSSIRTTAPKPITGRSGYAREVNAPPPRSGSRAHDFDDDALLAAAVELGVEHLLPRPEVERAAGDRQQHLGPHERALQVRVGAVFAGL